MIQRLLIPLVSLTALALPAASIAASEVTYPRDCPALLRQTFSNLQDSQPRSLCEYRGKVLLVVNTASYCGFTSQYDGLEKLYARLKDKGLVVVGFPSNDFGQQEPGTDKEIADFCRLTYDVKFPMFSKTRVAGARANALFRALAQRTGQAPQWNFHKYLIDRSGKQVLSFDSRIAPDDPALQARITEFLEAAR